MQTLVLIYDGDMKDKTFSEVSEVMHLFSQRKNSSQEYEDEIIRRKKAVSLELIDELMVTTDTQNKKRIVQFLRMLSVIGDIKNAYLYNITPIDEKYGATRKVEVIVSSSQTKDDALLYQLLQ